MKLPSPQYRWLKTEDGSLTLHSEIFGEACHSTTGAKTETLLHYLQGCQVQERLLLYPQFKILEVGFGLGVGLLTCIETLGMEKSWHFVSMEIDSDLVDWFLEEYRQFDLIRHASKISPHLVYSKVQNVELTIIIGDARLELPHYLENNKHQFHAIFQDAFSPKRNPHLWTVEWFKLLKQYAHQQCILSTYSASSSIRKSLIESGWKVKKGHKFGPKRSSTRATISGESDSDILTHLARSPVTAIYDSSIEEFIKNQKKATP